MYRYASFNRPLWIGFDPGVSFLRVDNLKSDEFNGRILFDVIEI